VLNQYLYPVIMKLNQVRLDSIPEELVDELEAAPIVCIVTHAIQLFWLGLGLVSTSVFIFAGCCTCVRLDACGPHLNCPS
jgi:hypothetical protein